MDQDSFRQLLQKPAASSSTSSSTHVRGSLLAAASTAPSGKKKAKAVDASQPAFKPRTLKKNPKGEEYRDRATERRLGTNNDYAQVEALAEDFERRNAENADRQAVEEQRKYLGGDSQHTVLVKGLDFALLEQTRARAAAEAAATDDVSLEQAFTESVAQPKKRTREEILRDLKSKRGTAGPSTDLPAPADEAFVEAKKAGKFKPIGFKPVGSNGAAEGKTKRKKKVKAGASEENGERKKKRKVVVEAASPEPSISAQASNGQDTPAVGPSAAPSSNKPASTPKPEAEPIDEDFDIFADAGEYTGIDLGDDDEGSDDEGPVRPSHRIQRDEEEGEVRGHTPPRPGKWLVTSEDEREPTPPPPPAGETKSAPRSQSPQRRPEGPHRPVSDQEEGGMEEEEERPVRLQPLSSSVVPSIKDLLAASDEVEKAEKRKARKEKKKVAGGGGGTSEKDTKAKVDRDYQRLKAYQDKQNKS